MHVKIILTSKIKHLQVVTVTCTLQKIATDLFFSLFHSFFAFNQAERFFLLSLSLSFHPHFLCRALF